MQGPSFCMDDKTSSAATRQFSQNGVMSQLGGLMSNCVLSICLLSLLASQSEMSLSQSRALQTPSWLIAREAIGLDSLGDDSTRQSYLRSCIGFGLGVQVQGGSVARLLVLSCSFEHSITQALVIPLELHVFQDHQREFRNAFLLYGSLKMTVKLPMCMRIFVQLGGGAGSISLFPTFLHVGFGAQVAIGETLLALSVRRTSYYPELREFLILSFMKRF
jgi:hypothetical protein